MPGFALFLLLLLYLQASLLLQGAGTLPARETRLLAPFLDLLDALLTALLQLLLHAQVQTLETALVACRPEKRGNAIEDARPRLAVQGHEAGLVGLDVDGALRRLHHRFAVVHPVVGARLSGRASLRYHVRFVLGAANPDRHGAGDDSIIAAAQLADPAGNRAERALQQGDHRLVVRPAFRLVIGDPHLGVGTNADITAVFHVEVHLAAVSRDDAVALVQGVIELRPAQGLVPVVDAHIAFDQDHLAGDRALGRGIRGSLRAFALRERKRRQARKQRCENQTKHAFSRGRIPDWRDPNEL